MIVRRQCKALPLVSRYFTQRGVRPFMAGRSTNDELVLGYVRSRLGIAVMPACFRSDGIAMPRLAGLDATRSVGFRLAADSISRVRSSKTFDAILDAARALTAGSDATRKA